MSIGFFIGIVCAVALGVYIGLKFHENPKKCIDLLKTVVFWVVIIGVALGIIYGLFLGGSFLTHKMREAGYSTTGVVIWWLIIFGLLTAGGGGATVAAKNNKKEVKKEKKYTKAEIEKREKKHKRNEKFMYGCLISLTIITILLLAVAFIYDKNR